MATISFARGAPSLDIVDVEGLKEASRLAFSSDPAGTTAYGTSVGYLVGPQAIIKQIQGIATNTYISPNMVAQSIVNQFARSGRMDGAIATVKDALRDRRDALVAALGELLPEWRFFLPGGGVTLWAELDGPISSALSRAAEEVGVRLAPGPRFGLDGTLERFLRLPFTLPADDLTDAVKRIAAVRHDLDRATRPEWRKPAIIA